MRLFILRFWPVLLPLLAYIWWMRVARRNAIKAGVTPPRFRDGPWFWAVVASLSIGVVIFLIMGLSNAPSAGNYIPPHMENGKVIEGHIEP